MKHDVAGAWAVVLAGGEGSRLRYLTTTDAGEVIPKQFCSLNANGCLLELALARAREIAEPGHVCSVVAAKHRRWWQEPLRKLSKANVFVQPNNRGTAVGAALALLEIEKIDPEATVVLLPADHYVCDEGVLAESLRQAVEWAKQEPYSIFLLGTEPDSADEEVGYIVPGASERGTAARVMEFVEKPDAALAISLISRRALWNMFIFAGNVQALLGLFERSHNFLPLLRNVLRNGDADALADAYQELPSVDLSRDILAHYPQRLRVVTVPPCGWTDLGTPKRLEATVRTAAAQSFCGPLAPALYLDLAQRLGRSGG
jgi:mannose-1-phosphate guanylyltransferase